MTVNFVQAFLLGLGGDLFNSVDQYVKQIRIDIIRWFNEQTQHREIGGTIDTTAMYDMHIGTKVLAINHVVRSRMDVILQYIVRAIYDVRDHHGWWGTGSGIETNLDAMIIDGKREIIRGTRTRLIRSESDA